MAVAVDEPIPPASAPAHSSSRQELIARQEAHQRELERLDDELRRLKELRRGEKNSIRELMHLLGPGTEPDKKKTVARGDEGGVKDYSGRFEWSEALKGQMQCVFGIKSFRLAQEGYVLRLIPDQR